MLSLGIFHVVFLLFTSTVDSKRTPVEKYRSEQNKDYDAALKFLEENDELAIKMANKYAIAGWNYGNSFTDENEKAWMKSLTEIENFDKETQEKTKSFAWKDFKNKNETIYRWFKYLAQVGKIALPEDKHKKFNALIAVMQKIYFKAKVCPKDNPTGKPCELSLNPGLTKIFQNSRDYDELKHVWTEWRKATSKVKPQFLEYVKLKNEAAALNGFTDAGAMWRDRYDSESFANDLEELWKVIEPFYQQLHAFVRRRLISQYPDKGISPDGPIPAHLLGNMWAQSWENIYDIVKPYPNKKESVDVTERMLEKKMTALDMFKLSEEFFTSLGLYPMTTEFWERSIIENPDNREMSCSASPWDFSDGKDFRIKMCTRVNMEDLITIHREMGVIEYYQHYAHQPMAFRKGANPGFPDAIGNTFALSVETQEHLKKVNLLDQLDNDKEMEINKLMKEALQKVAFLPFIYMIDSYRWKIFSGEISENELNSKWWEQRLKYQGVCPPVRRTNDDLDAASRYHVIANLPYMKYFVTYILQFQFHKSLCEAGNYTGPLNHCDIYQNREAGRLLSKAMSLGSSVNWSEAMKIITKGKTSKMDAQPLMEYFEPLIKWLQKQNEGETLGWKSNDPMICP